MGQIRSKKRREELIVLTLTSGAVQVIRTVTANPELPPETGIRIESGLDGSDALRLSVAPAPEAGDQVVEEEGAKVYLEAAVAEMLDDKTLDAQVDPQGDVAFTIAEGSGGTPT
ncbi:MAG: Fe-S cluster assembly protein HesB [Spirillospora sp.]